MISKTFPGPAWTSSHVYGQGVMNLQEKFCYFHIPKCASMWMRKYLSNMGEYHLDGDWVECNFTRDNINDFVKIIILRDPVKRWISALPFKDNAVDTFNKEPGAFNLIFENLEEWLYDEHHARQTSFIAGLDLSNTVFFWCDENLAINMEDFFIKQDFRNTQPPPPVNEHDDSQLTADVIKTWQQLLCIPKYLDSFYKTFAKDYELINSVKFYKAHNVN